MTKYHLTQAGETVLCSATIRSCPIGGEHFSSRQAAEAALASELGTFFDGHRKSRLPRITIMGLVTTQADGRYYGCHVSQNSIAPYLEVFREAVGPEKAKLMENNKSQRDRGEIYHLTVVTPPEMKTINKSQLPPPEVITITYKGVGRAADDKNEAWFIVCHAPEIETWRNESGLDAKDLHITLGFESKDVHTQPKGDSSLVIV